MTDRGLESIIILPKLQCLKLRELSKITAEGLMGAYNSKTLKVLEVKLCEKISDDDIIKDATSATKNRAPGNILRLSVNNFTRRKATQVTPNLQVMTKYTVY